MNRKITTSLGRLGGACAGVALLACAAPGGGSGGSSAAHAAGGAALASDASVAAWGSADGYYALGRSQYAAQRYAAALDSYRQALRREPGHRDAGNGLAVLYAEQGDYAAAIALWQALIALDGAAAEPRGASLFGNLGYAYLLSGQAGAAVAALEQACLLAPLNANHWAHLASALEQAGQGERAALMRRQAQALQAHDVRADYALAGRAGQASQAGMAGMAGTTGMTMTGMTGVAGALAAASPLDEAAWPAGIARNEVVTTSAGLLELRRVAVRPAQGGDAGRPAPGASSGTPSGSPSAAGSIAASPAKSAPGPALLARSALPAVSLSSVMPPVMRPVTQPVRQPVMQHVTQPLMQPVTQQAMPPVMQPLISPAPSPLGVASAVAPMVAEAPGTVATMSAPSAESRPPPGSAAPLRLEIRNGNGVAGMASVLARTVAAAGGLQVIKVANAANFQVERTRIEYGPQHQLAALAFAARLAPDAVIAEADFRAADLRVVIGRDLTDPAALRRYYLKQLKLARLELGKLAAAGLVAVR